MARPVVLSNGELHVGLNKYGMVHDFYFPYVGLENHASGKLLRHRIGIWVDGQISWLDNEIDWTIQFRYPHDALIGHTVAKNVRLGIALEFDDFVDADISAFVRSIHVINLRETARDIRLFMHQAFVIGDGASNTDTAQYLPDSDAILHYRGRRAFVISGQYDDAPFDQYTVGLFGIEGREGTFRDADDGELSMSTVEHGRVDSTIRFRMDIPAHSSARVHYWVAAGTSTREALFVHKQIRESGPTARMRSTANWWHRWLEPAHEVARRIDPDHQQNFIQSVMLIKSQIDKRGAVIASTDSTMLNYARDAYAYCWPRDGSLVLWPLIRMGYTDEARRFFEFCRHGLHPNGYLMHKYRADGALGSSWHPYVHEGGVIAPPIQLDETALTLFVFAQFYQMHASPQLLRDFYESFVSPMANFLADYTDETTGLPQASYDLWEEVFTTATFTTATIYAALLAAADLAAEADDSDSAIKWRSAADDIARAAHRHLYNAERKSFYKGISVVDGEIIKDDTIDASSVFGAFMFGLFPATGDELKQAVQSLQDTFQYGTNGVEGIPRYEHDAYYRTHPDAPSNWWFITTLWLGQYFVETGDAAAGKRILDWVQSQMLSTGVLSEQVDPQSGALTSVAPLTWSHAEYVATLLDTITE